MTLVEVRALRAAGKHADHLAAATELVADEPDNVDAQIEAAYAHDAAGRERLALRHYEEAYRLGVPAAEHQQFVVGFGSTLRNAGRADEAVAVLARAVVDEPGYMPFHAFLSPRCSPQDIRARHSPRCSAALSKRHARPRSIATSARSANITASCSASSSRPSTDTGPGMRDMGAR